MAATGYTPISLYYSSTATNVPLSTNLVAGELALNTADEKLYFKNSSGTVKLLASNTSSSATVSSVAQSFTGGIVSVAGSPITTSGTLALTVAGTSGGIPYFSSATTWATSGLLTANALVLGGGAGASPTSLGAGTTTTVLHGNASGAPTFGSVSLTADVSGTLPVASGGTGVATTTAYAVQCGGTTATGAHQPVASVGTTGQVLTSNGASTLPTFQTIVSGATISNDTATATYEYPLYAAATSGTPVTIYTSNAKYLYKPSTGDLQASQVASSNGLLLNNATIATSYTIASGYNAMSTGPVTISGGVTVTVGSGSRYVVI